MISGANDRRGAAITPPYRATCALFGAIALLRFVTGCGTSIDEDYRIGSGNLHPFADAAEHGAWLAANDYTFAACTPCHGADLRGQEVGANGGIERSCYGCHTATEHQVGFTIAEDEHPAYLRAIHWDLGRCFVCHPEPESPGTATRRSPLPASPTFGSSCSTVGCHDAANGGPVACNVCHGDSEGDPGVPASWAPPEDLEGDVATSSPGVGAHQTHLGAPSGFSAAVPCRACHLVPASWDDPGHIDDTPATADVTFSEIAGGAARYDFATSSCAATDCHRSGEPVWTEVDGTWNECGACHGLPPISDEHPFGPGVEDCHRCHGMVIDENDVFIAPDLHINGEVNVDDD
jgi:predicted CxxxxCH...CXXCH cytochrome family protein